MTMEEFMNIGEELIQCAIDFHVHTGPDIVPRKYTDVQLAGQYQKAGMAGFISKCHHGDTSARAAAVSEMFSSVKVYGGIVLNHAVGGLNEAAVYACGKMGGKIVWFPTVDAHNDAEFKKYHSDENLGRGNEQPGQRRKIRIMNENHELIPEVYPVLKQIQEQEMILATGHISPAESLALLKAASKMGIRRMIVSHVSFPLTNAVLDLQREFLACGAMLEHCFYTPYYGMCSWEDILKSIYQAGAERILLSTDFGQKKSPDPAEGMKMFAGKLHESGISEKEIRQMMVKNPKNLLEV